MRLCSHASSSRVVRAVPCEFITTKPVSDAVPQGQSERKRGRGKRSALQSRPSTRNGGFGRTFLSKEQTMTRLAAPALFFFAYLASPLRAPQSSAPAGQVYQLKPTPQTVVWGYYDAKTPPVLHIKSGDTVEIQTVIASSPERFESAGMGQDQIEPALRDIYREVKEKGP